MSHAPLIERDAVTEDELVQTFLAGLKQFRQDLSYPESHSDMRSGIRAVMVMFNCQRRPLPIPLRIKCGGCGGTGELVHEASAGYRRLSTCNMCNGRGHLGDRKE